MFKPVNVLLYRALYFVCGVHYIRTKGKRAKTTEAPILCVAPHSSHIDPLLGLLSKPPSVVSTRENGDVPLIGGKRLGVLISLGQCLNGDSFCKYVPIE